MNRVERALAAVRAAVEGTIDGKVDRIDVDANGALHVTVAREIGWRWFRFEGEQLSEVSPISDVKIALARVLAEDPETRYRVLAYRPGRRLVVLTERQGETVVLKGYRAKRSRPAARAHQVAEAAGEGGGFVVAPLLDHDLETETLAFGFVRAERLALGPEGVPRFRAIGRALRRWQEAPVGSELSVFGPDDELGVLDRWAERTQLALDALPTGWARARERLDALRAGLPEEVLGLSHRDLHDGQFLDTRPVPTVLDFDLLCRADVALDPANLAAHLDLRVLQGIHGATPAAARDAAEALRAGIGDGRGEGFTRRLAFYQTTTYLRLALVYGLRPTWSHLTPDLLELAEARMQDLVRSSPS